MPEIKKEARIYDCKNCPDSCPFREECEAAEREASRFLEPDPTLRRERDYSRKVQKIVSYAEAAKLARAYSDLLAGAV
jgi:hypothetical protein